MQRVGGVGGAGAVRRRWRGGAETGRAPLALIAQRVSPRPRLAPRRLERGVELLKRRVLGRPHLHHTPRLLLKSLLKPPAFGPLRLRRAGAAARAR